MAGRCVNGRDDLTRRSYAPLLYVRPLLRVVLLLRVALLLRVVLLLRVAAVCARASLLL
jgi:hypothetical protein